MSTCELLASFLSPGLKQVFGRAMLGKVVGPLREVLQGAPGWRVFKAQGKMPPARVSSDQGRCQGVVQTSPFPCSFDALEISEQRGPVGAEALRPDLLSRPGPIGLAILPNEVQEGSPAGSNLTRNELTMQGENAIDASVMRVMAVGDQSNHQGDCDDNGLYRGGIPAVLLTVEERGREYQGKRNKYERRGETCAHLASTPRLHGCTVDGGATLSSHF